MTRFSLISVVLFWLISFNCTGENGSSKGGRDNEMNSDLQRRLEAEIRRRADSKDTSPLEIKDLTDFGWEKLFVFNPYTPTSYIEKTLGFTSDEIRRVDMDRREDINLLVFTQAGRAATVIEFPRRSGDFDKVDRSEGFTPDAARFSVALEDRGEPWVTLREAP